MNISILHKISEAIKKENISINGLYYQFSDIFPESFYETVTNYLERAYSQYENKGKIKEFFIGFDKNKNAYLEFVGKIEDPNDIGETEKIKEVRVIVIQDNIRYDCVFPASLIIKENIFLENVKNLDHAKNRYIYDSLPINFIKRFAKKFDQAEPIENYFEELSEEIIRYINYLEKEANKTYELLEKELAKAKEIDKIYFIESEASTNTTKVSSPSPGIQSERKNDEIPLEQRLEVLESYSPNDEFEAISKNSSSIYYVKVFNVKQKCKLVMEPKEGNKYTKIVHIDNDRLSKEELKKIVIDTLELSRSETTEQENITRHSHTTLEEYKNLLEYLINSKNTGIHYGTIKRIDEASDTKTR